MKFIEPRLLNADVAARKLVELANAVEPVQDGRLYIELINAPFLYQLKGTPAEYKAGLECAIANGWLWLHESGTYVKLAQDRNRLIRARLSVATIFVRLVVTSLPLSPGQEETPLRRCQRSRSRFSQPGELVQARPLRAFVLTSSV
jgi:hypothetical protein